MSILVVMEQRSGQWNRMSFETLAAAQQLAKELGTTAGVLERGDGLRIVTRVGATARESKYYACEQ